jgi:hypothetical protein
VYAILFSKYLKGRDHLEVIGVGGGYIQMYLERKGGVEEWNVFMFFRIKSRGGLLWTP